MTGASKAVRSVARTRLPERFNVLMAGEAGRDCVVRVWVLVKKDSGPRAGVDQLVALAFGDTADAARDAGRPARRRAKICVCIGLRASVLGTYEVPIWRSESRCSWRPVYGRKPSALEPSALSALLVSPTSAVSHG
jgi:hypothetical protein